MRYYQLPREGTGSLVVETADGAYDLTAATPDLDSFRALARTAAITDRTPDEVTRARLDDAPGVDRSTLDAGVGLPLDVDEVWAAGVTYEISEEARREESSTPDMYIDVYDADRPEVFFKATRNRTVGPGANVGVRGDAEWNVPEPELGVVLHRGEIVGYTVGNDVSSRDIEGANPLYLPQAKVFDRCCSLGPCVATDVADPHDLAMSMTIERDGAVAYEEATTTAEMVRTCEELVSYVDRHNAIPELTVVLTGTSLVPPESFTLSPGDVVEIDIEEIGTLRNGVTRV